MDSWLKRAARLLTSISFGSDGSASVVPYYPQKVRVYGEEKKYFRRTIPEHFGISSKRLFNMLSELEGERRANIHNLFVLAGGEVICECSRDGYGTNIWHLSHSMSKTVTGMAIGMLVDDGRLKVTDRLVNIFPEVPYKDKRFADITVRHLLSMQTGVPFAEAGSVTEVGWTEAFFSSSLKFAPGESFSYNSMNSYILSKIVTRLTGMTLSAFLDERLFSPLGITNYFWEIGPEGVEKGGWGLFLSPESWAKIGYMFLSGGVFEDRRILSEEWIEESSTRWATSPMSTGDFNYAYQMWVGRESEEILFNGMLGQNVWICPKNNIVVVVNCGNNELFQMSPALDIIRKYLGCDIEDALSHSDIRTLHEREAHFFDSRRWVRPLEKKRGLLYFLHLRSRESFDIRWSDILGEYVLAKNNAGILPLFVTGMQNNLDTVIERISLSRAGESLVFSFTESGVDYSLEVGLYEYKSTVLDFRGEKYAVSVMGEALTDRDGVGEYRIEFLFPEMPNTRMIKIKPDAAGRITVTLSEVPNDKIVDLLIKKVPNQNGVAGFVLDMLERRFGEGFIQKKLEEIFSPTIVGADVTHPDAEKIMEEELRRVEDESGVVRLIRSVVARFFKESVGISEARATEQTSSEADGKSSDKRGFFSSILGKIKKRR
ncbi:MAG: serine hydrolase [Clostridia bacterium]|nr:serine hydrolase [Clostridia bacterium]